MEFLLLELSTLSNKFSCDDVTEDCLDLGMVNMVLGLVPEIKKKYVYNYRVSHIETNKVNKNVRLNPGHYATKYHYLWIIYFLS